MRLTFVFNGITKNRHSRTVCNYKWEKLVDTLESLFNNETPKPLTIFVEGTSLKIDSQESWQSYCDGDHVGKRLIICPTQNGKNILPKEKKRNPEILPKEEKRHPRQQSIVHSKPIVSKPQDVSDKSDLGMYPKTLQIDRTSTPPDCEVPPLGSRGIEARGTDRHHSDDGNSNEVDIEIPGAVMDMKSDQNSHEASRVSSTEDIDEEMAFDLDDRAYITHIYNALMEKPDTDVSGKNIVMLVGATGSGKSTTMCFLAGQKMREHYDVGTRKYVIDVADPKKAAAKVGHKPVSETVHVKSYVVNDDNTLADSPGFEDSKGFAQDFANAVNICNSLENCKTFRILFLFEHSHVQFARGTKITEALKRFTGFVKQKNANILECMTFYLTKANKKDSALRKELERLPFRGRAKQLIQKVLAEQKRVVLDPLSHSEPYWHRLNQLRKIRPADVQITLPFSEDQWRKLRSACRALVDDIRTETRSNCNFEIASMSLEKLDFLAKRLSSVHSVKKLRNQGYDYVKQAIDKKAKAVHTILDRKVEAILDDDITKRLSVNMLHLHSIEQFFGTMDVSNIGLCKMALERFGIFVLSLSLKEEDLCHLGQDTSIHHRMRILRAINSKEDFAYFLGNREKEVYSNSKSLLKMHLVNVKENIEKVLDELKENGCTVAHCELSKMGNEASTALQNLRAGCSYEEHIPEDIQGFFNQSFQLVANQLGEAEKSCSCCTATLSQVIENISQENVEELKKQTESKSFAHSFSILWLVKNSDLSGFFERHASAYDKFQLDLDKVAGHLATCMDKFIASEQYGRMVLPVQLLMSVRSSDPELKLSKLLVEKLSSLKEHLDIQRRKALNEIRAENFLETAKYLKNVDASMNIDLTALDPPKGPSPKEPKSRVYLRVHQSMMEAKSPGRTQRSFRKGLKRSRDELLETVKKSFESLCRTLVDSCPRSPEIFLYRSPTRRRKRRSDGLDSKLDEDSVDEKLASPTRLRMNSSFSDLESDTEVGQSEPDRGIEEYEFLMKSLDKYYPVMFWLRESSSSFSRFQDILQHLSDISQGLKINESLKAADPLSHGLFEYLRFLTIAFGSMLSLKMWEEPEGNGGEDTRKLVSALQKDKECVQDQFYRLQEKVIEEIKGIPQVVRDNLETVGKAIDAAAETGAGNKDTKQVVGDCKGCFETMRESIQTLASIGQTWCHNRIIAPPQFVSALRSVNSELTKAQHAASTVARLYFDKETQNAHGRIQRQKHLFAVKAFIDVMENAVQHFGSDIIDASKVEGLRNAYMVSVHGIDKRVPKLLDSLAYDEVASILDNLEADRDAYEKCRDVVRGHMEQKWKEYKRIDRQYRGHLSMSKIDLIIPDELQDIADCLIYGCPLDKHIRKTAERAKQCWANLKNYVNNNGLKSKLKKALQSTFNFALAQQLWTKIKEFNNFDQFPEFLKLKEDMMFFEKVTHDIQKEQIGRIEENIQRSLADALGYEETSGDNQRGSESEVKVGHAWSLKKQSQVLLDPDRVRRILQGCKDAAAKDVDIGGVNFIDISPQNHRFVEEWVGDMVEAMHQQIQEGAELRDVKRNLEKVRHLLRACNLEYGNSDLTNLQDCLNDHMCPQIPNEPNPASLERFLKSLRQTQSNSYNAYKASVAEMTEQLRTAAKTVGSMLKVDSVSDALKAQLETLLAYSTSLKKHSKLAESVDVAKRLKEANKYVLVWLEEKKHDLEEFEKQKNWQAHTEILKGVHLLSTFELEMEAFETAKKIDEVHQEANSRGCAQRQKEIQEAEERIESISLLDNILAEQTLVRDLMTIGEIREIEGKVLGPRHDSKKIDSIRSKAENARMQIVKAMSELDKKDPLFHTNDLLQKTGVYLTNLKTISSVRVLHLPNIAGIHRPLIMKSISNVNLGFRRSLDEDLRDDPKSAPVLLKNLLHFTKWVQDLHPEGVDSGHSFIDDLKNNIKADIKGFKDDISDMRCTAFAHRMVGIHEKWDSLKHPELSKVVVEQLSLLMGIANRDLGLDYHELGNHLKEMGAIGGCITAKYPHFKRVKYQALKKATAGVTLSEALSLMENSNDRNPINAKKLSSMYDTFLASFGKRDAMLMNFNRSSTALGEMVKDLKKTAVHMRKRGKMKDYPAFIGQIFAFWSVFTATYSDSDRGIHSNFDRVSSKDLMEPHVVQVLTIFRLLGLDTMAVSWYDWLRGKSPKYTLNHLCQVATGGGKSIILGILATLFALLDHDVSCVCYSEFLSKRDEKSFEPLWRELGIQHRITYSTFAGMADRFINKDLKVREKTRRLVEGSPSMETANNKFSGQGGSKKVLLFDEVDVFFHQDFYGNTYNAGTSIWRREILHLTEIVWKNRHSIRFSELASMKDAKSLFERFPKWLMTLQLRKMLSEVKPVDDTQIYQIKDGKIGFPMHGSINFDLSGYFVSFCYWKEYQLGRVSREVVERYAGQMFIACGQFSFAKIPNSYDVILGVTATLKQMSSYEKQIMEMQFKIAGTTLTPSMYGETKITEKGVHIEQNAIRFHQKIFQRIMMAYEKRRPVLVFFKDNAAMIEFWNKRKGDLPTMTVVDEKCPNIDAEVEAATRLGAVTLFPKVFCRGLDFVCYESKVKEEGVHVIQAFFAETLSEEKQAKGRTARNGAEGSYEMILNMEDLEKEYKAHGLDAAKIESAIRNQNVYEVLCEARNKRYEATLRHRRHNTNLSENEHKTSMEYLRSLLKGKETSMRLLKQMSGMGSKLEKEDMPHYVPDEDPLAKKYSKLGNQETAGGFAHGAIQMIRSGDIYKIDQKMTEMKMGLGWTSQHDLAAGVCLYDAVTHKFLEVVQWDRLKSETYKISHSGDVTDGKASGVAAGSDQEVVTVDLESLGSMKEPPILVFCMAIYTSEVDFDQVENGYMRLIDTSDSEIEVEACRMNLTKGDIGKSTRSIALAKVYMDKASGAWSLEALTAPIGDYREPVTMANAKEMLEKVKFE